MSAPKRIAGGFIDSNIISAKLIRKGRFDREFLEEMVLGKWSWSSDGKVHDYFIFFKEDHSCSFQNS